MTEDPQTNDIGANIPATNDMKMAVVGVVSVAAIAALVVGIASQQGIELSEGTLGLFMAAITGIVALAK